MIQLRATYEGQVYDIDLYDEAPIKLNLSVEDITNADATSTFSRTFRVPANRRNNRFFKHAFEINGIDYDVTIKKPADVLVDGALFKTGHIRLQKIYTNGATGQIDYEILFLGETRDFASVLGDAKMCELDVPEVDLPNLDRADVVTSWNAYDGTGTYSNSGLADGNVIFPLIDHGNLYDTGTLADSQINIVSGGAPSFIDNAHPISFDRLKPMIRMRLLFEKIFENNGFTINFPLLQTDRFAHMYVSAFGNEALPYAKFSDVANLRFEGTETSNFGFIAVAPLTTRVTWASETDAGNNFTTATGTYTVPPSGNGGTFTFEYSFDVENIGTNAATLTSFIRRRRAGVTTTVSTADVVSLPVPSGLINTSGFTTITVQTGDEFFVECQASAVGPAPKVAFSNSSTDYFRTGTITAGTYNPVTDMDCEYKQIDFVKDILTTFRLVMEPDASTPRRFNIKPFDQYIASGDVYDWTDKLDRSKDLTIEPLFNSQSDQIEFKFTEEGDWINDYHQKAYKHVYGRLLFDSQNELLVGKREIKTNFAPTEVTQIEGTGAGPTDPKTWVLPQVHTHGGADNTHDAIKAKTRLLFYNGKKTVPTSQAPWHMVDQLSTDPNPGGTPPEYTEWPLVTQYEHFPPLLNDLILTFNRDTAYWYDGTTGGYNNVEYLNGVTLYTAYWQNYIEALYNKYSRRVTGTFVLNYDDLKDFTFDDIVFVDNAYYRVEKIIDTTLTETVPTKVQLLKLNDYDPNAAPIGVLNVTLVPTDTTCFGDNDGQLEVTYSGGVGPYTYSINGGTQITAPASPFTITGLSAGNYTVTVTDANSTQGSDIEVVSDGNPELILTIGRVSQPSTCGASDGTATYTVTGGTPPYYITGVFGSYAGVTSVTETNIPAGSYQISVTDAVLCSVSQPLNMTEPTYCVDDSLITDIRQQDYTVGCYQEGVGWPPETGSTVIVTVGSGPHIGKYAWLGNTWSDFLSTYPTGTLVDIQNLIYPSIQCGEWVKYDITTPYFSIGEDGLCVQCDQPQGPSDSSTDYTAQKGNWNWRV